jgi:glycine cleavage system H lipoate-binding protein
MEKKNFNKPVKQKGVKGYQVLENECIWMKAGVVNFHLCENAYDCNNCPFDKSMQIAMGKNSANKGDRKTSGWPDNLVKQHDGSSRPCRHALTGRVGAPKICPFNYECYHCPYDQWLDESDISLGIIPPEYKQASGFRLADGYYYHMGHSWVLFEHGGIARVGFDDFLVRLFGTMETIKLPNLGHKLQQGVAGLAFSREKFEAEVLSPVTGKVLAVNQKAMDYPGIPHEDPYQSGWLCIVEPTLPMNDAKTLFYGSESLNWMESEKHRLMALMGPEYENLSSTGAELVGDIFGNFPELGWNRLVKEFLKI